MAYKRGQGSFFVQEDLTTEFDLLTCTGVGDISIPSGDVTPMYCPDPENAGAWIIDDYVYGEPGLGSASIEKPLENVYNFLVENACGYNGLITYNCDGVRTTPLRYNLAALLFNAINTDKGIATPVAAQPDDDDRVLTTATVNFATLQMIYGMEWAQQSLSNTADANGVAFLPRRCVSSCSTGRELCEIGFLGLDGTQYNSEVKYTIDSGANWTQTTTDPFWYDGGDAGKPIIFELTNAERVIVPRISLASGEYAEIAYTEDRGVTWTNVYVGTRTDQWLTKLWSYRGRVWAAATNGFIYVSDDFGSSWTAQESGVETTETLRDGVMYSDDVGYCVGDNNTFLYTLNAGSDWASRTGPAVGADLLSVAVNFRGYVFVGASDGTLYYSTDRGVTWVTRTAFGVGTVPAIYFDATMRYIGFLIYNTGAPVGSVYRSINGGATWQEVSPTSMPTNAGLNDLWICDANTVIAVGEAYAGTTFVAQAITAAA